MQMFTKYSFHIFLKISSYEFPPENIVARKTQEMWEHSSNLVSPPIQEFKGELSLLGPAKKKALIWRAHSLGMVLHGRGNKAILNQKLGS